MGKGSTPKVKQSPTDIATADQIKKIEEQFSGPLRALITPQALQTLGGPGVFQTSLPGVDRDTIEKQFKQAQTGIQNNAGARGGELNAQMADLQKSRAFSVADATNQSRQRGIERALGLVPTALPNANAQLGAMGNIAGHEQNANMANAQMQAQAQQGKGQMSGKMAGGALSALGSSGALTGIGTALMSF